jgi:hypothetical protein
MSKPHGVYSKTKAYAKIYRVTILPIMRDFMYKIMIIEDDEKIRR